MHGRPALFWRERRGNGWGRGKIGGEAGRREGMEKNCDQVGKQLISKLIKYKKRNVNKRREVNLSLPLPEWPHHCTFLFRPWLSFLQVTHHRWLKLSMKHFIWITEIFIITVSVWLFFSISIYWIPLSYLVLHFFLKFSCLFVSSWNSFGSLFVFFFISLNMLIVPLLNILSGI